MGLRRTGTLVVLLAGSALGALSAMLTVLEGAVGVGWPTRGPGPGASPAGGTFPDEPAPAGVRGRVRVEHPFEARVFLHQGETLKEVASVTGDAPSFAAAGFAPGPAHLVVVAEVLGASEFRLAIEPVTLPREGLVDVGVVTPGGGRATTLVLRPHPPHAPAPPGARARVTARVPLPRAGAGVAAGLAFAVPLGQPVVVLGLPDAPVAFTAEVPWDGDPATPRYLARTWASVPEEPNFVQEVRLERDGRPSPPPTVDVAIHATLPPGVADDAFRVRYVGFVGEDVALAGAVEGAGRAWRDVTAQFARVRSDVNVDLYALANGFVAGPVRLETHAPGAPLAARFTSWRPAATLRLRAVGRDGKPAARATVWVARGVAAAASGSTALACGRAGPW